MWALDVWRGARPTRRPGILYPIESVRSLAQRSWHLFGIGSWEFIVIAALALLLFGPDKLPEFARTAGRFMRDFKRYQAMMESTIRAEMYTADPKVQKDPFKTGKEFAEKVGQGSFGRPGKATADPVSPSSVAQHEKPAESQAGSAEPSPRIVEDASGKQADAPTEAPGEQKQGEGTGSQGHGEGGSAQA